MIRVIVSKQAKASISNDYLLQMKLSFQRVPYSNPITWSMPAITPEWIGVSRLGLNYIAGL